MSNIELLREMNQAAKSNDPFKDVGTLNATERVETDFDNERFEQNFSKIFAPHQKNTKQNEGIETI
jgi:hypothetical protein